MKIQNSLTPPSQISPNSEAYPHPSHVPKPGDMPAIAKAIQAYDVKTRPILKYFKLMRHDPRNVERKKFGRIKARKG